ncbi:ABC transporter permease [Mucilaginibacter ginkgonis]|uniref:ABC transporter permease n=1 Tax=Mucilaginibacter ginkgonis TaxID=2682091 RepID=A0A6I4HX89_9SPHI|nr:ABC transporter permease [Mucilaginibacter ginkgonis]QQL51453.1 ABC transporter permease [Mucilaginibacter ginkgonis]
MLKNYFKVALRNIAARKLFSFINVLGLSIGISAALVIYLIVEHDLSFDKFHSDRHRIYRVVSNFIYMGNPGYNRGVSMPLPDAIAAEIPEVAKLTHYYTWDFDVTIPNTAGNAKFKAVENIVFTDKRYFGLFKYKWLAGNMNTALSQPNQVVLTQKQAKLYFPKLNAPDVLGKIVAYNDTIKTSVVGVVADFEGNTDITFHDFISWGTALTNAQLKRQFRTDNWGGTTSSSQCFVMLDANADPSLVEKKVTQLYYRHDPRTPQNKDVVRNYHLQPLSDLHFGTNYGTVGYNQPVSKTVLYGLLVIASFLLLLGCINFINLVTAQSSQRAKEIGIRKTIGSTRQQLVVQLLSETFIITLVAVLISLACAPLILKLFADFISPDVKLDLLNHPGVLLFLALLTIVVALLSGFYPALLLSRYKPIEVLKSQSVLNSGTTRTAWMRKSLTVTQFVIAQFFIMATILVSKQVYYAVHKDLGFKKDAIIYMWTPYKKNSNYKIAYFKDKIAAMPQVAMISRGSNPPSSSNTNSTEGTYKDGKKEIKTNIQMKYGDANYIKLYQIKLLAGRNIEPTDTSKAFLINVAYTRAMGLKNPADAVGKIVDKFNGDSRMQIIGVVSDFQQGSLHEALEPLCIQWYPSQYNNEVLHVELKPQSAGGTEWADALAAIKTEWKKIYPEDDFTYHFYDESISKFYESEQHTSRLLMWSSGLSVLISCLGLLGLAMYTTRTRTKEIGVRKVLGATVAQIIALLSREIVLLIVLAFVIVTPLAYWAMHTWIQNFADRTSISWWIFALSGLGMLLTAMLTSTTQTFRAATANPVKSLRSE